MASESDHTILAEAALIGPKTPSSFNYIQCAIPSVI